jgi:Carboxyl transferase domain
VKKAKTREQRLMGVYQQLAVQFSDLHDTPGRMQATGAVRKVSCHVPMLVRPAIWLQRSSAAQRLFAPNLRCVKLAMAQPNADT